AAAITGAPQRGFVQSVFRAAANITFPANFLLSLNALDAPRVPNSLQLSAPGGTRPFSALRVGMPVLLGAQRLHIEALALSLDLTYCTRWHPKIVRPEQLNPSIIAKNSAWLAQYVAHYSHPPSTPGYPLRVPLPWTTTKLSSMVGVPLTGTLAAGTGMGPWAEVAAFPSIQDMAQQLCGRGPGLTPSGDDILAGWMAANWLLHGEHPRLLMANQDILAVAERQTHLLSQCWLRYAAGGYVAEPIGLLLQTLTRENEVELASATQAVLALGATSGRDVIHGILLGLAGIPAW
ncbi:MAG TPA: DUF2877 domain-containing protein, partial [Ktedonobacteraceae bacterium]|nr:DUF2877 domain-containing protein [Ktedonobacteraceae bacterium]